MEPADPARGPRRRVSLQYSGAAAASRRAGRILLRKPGVVPESGARRLRARFDRRALHFSRRLPGRPADVVAALLAARPAGPALVQVLGGHAAVTGARADSHRSD